MSDLVQKYADGESYKNGHVDASNNCPRCCASVRPACPTCGHSLSGSIHLDGTSTCEVCDNVFNVKQQEAERILNE